MEDANSNLDFTELLKLAQNMMSTQKKADPNRLSELDQLVNNQELRILKATLPYFEVGYQKKIATYLKISELTNAMNLFKNQGEGNETKPLSKEFNKLQLLSDIRDCCDEPQQKKLNSMIMLMNLRQALEDSKNAPKFIPSEKKEPATDSSNNDNFNHIMNMMNKIIKEKE